MRAELWAVPAPCVSPGSGLVPTQLAFVQFQLCKFMISAVYLKGGD